jgi:hypothetical protein
MPQESPVPPLHDVLLLPDHVFPYRIMPDPAPFAPHEQSAPQLQPEPLPQEQESVPVFTAPVIIPVHVPLVAFAVPQLHESEAAKTPVGITSASRRTKTNNFDMA